MDVQESMQHIFQQHNKKAPARCKSVIRNSILANLQLESASLQGDHQLLDEFIPISRHSDCVRWEQLVEPIQPKENYKNVYLKSLFASNGQELTLIWAKQLIPEEVHSDVDESFLLLEGTVDCFIEEDIFHMKKGDFMRIPLGISHKIMVTSATPAKAILSRVQL
ncbi:MAG: cupin domain-containing protein [Bacteroidota bacterium]